MSALWFLIDPHFGQSSGVGDLPLIYNVQPGSVFASSFFRPLSREVLRWKGVVNRSLLAEYRQLLQGNVTTYDSFEYVSFKIRGGDEYFTKGNGHCPVHVLNPSYHCAKAQTRRGASLARNCSRGLENILKWRLHNCPEVFAPFACPLTLPVAAVVMPKALSTSFFKMLEQVRRFIYGQQIFFFQPSDR